MNFETIKAKSVNSMILKKFYQYLKKNFIYFCAMPWMYAHSLRLYYLNM